MGIIVVAALLLIGGNTILNGNSSLSPEVFITYIVVFSQIISPAKAFSNAWYFIQKGVASLDRVNSLLKEQAFYDIQPGTEEKKVFTSQIEIKNLNFYFGEKEILKDINLIIEKGKKVAFVGPSGSGKTTLLNILARIYNVAEGQVFIDGVDINDIYLNDYRSLTAIVTQDPILFYGTVEENLQMAAPHASVKEMEDALKASDALEFVSRLPNSIYTEIGERGQSLSIGQQQRLTLARAYLKNAPILFLDEATSSLDGMSDKQVQDAIKNLSAEKTVISIAHKLSSISDYDQIVFLERGEITGIGTHDTLMKSHNQYQKMVSAQAFEE